MQRNVVPYFPKKGIFSKNHNFSLLLNFKNWYDVKYTESGDDKSIVLSNYTNANDAYRMLRGTGKGVTLNNVVQYEYDYRDVPVNNDTTLEALNANARREEVDLINSDIRYYGDNKVPREAVGIVQVRDCAGGICGDVATGLDMDNPEDKIIQSRNDEVRMNLGFGVKK